MRKVIKKLFMAWKERQKLLLHAFFLRFSLQFLKLFLNFFDIFKKAVSDCVLL